MFTEHHRHKNCALCVSVILLVPTGLYHLCVCLLSLQMGQTATEAELSVNKLQRVFKVCCTALSRQGMKQKRARHCSCTISHMVHLEFYSPDVISTYA